MRLESEVPIHRKIDEREALPCMRWYSGPALREEPSV